MNENRREDMAGRAMDILGLDEGTRRAIRRPDEKKAYPANGRSLFFHTAVERAGDGGWGGE